MFIFFCMFIHFIKKMLVIYLLITFIKIQPEILLILSVYSFLILLNFYLLKKIKNFDLIIFINFLIFLILEYYFDLTLFNFTFLTKFKTVNASSSDEDEDEEDEFESSPMDYLFKPFTFLFNSFISFFTSRKSTNHHNPLPPQPIISRPDLDDDISDNSKSAYEDFGKEVELSEAELKAQVDLILYYEQLKEEKKISELNLFGKLKKRIVNYFMSVYEIFFTNKKTDVNVEPVIIIKKEKKILPDLTVNFLEELDTDISPILTDLGLITDIDVSSEIRAFDVIKQSEEVVCGSVNESIELDNHFSFLIEIENSPQLLNSTALGSKRLVSKKKSLTRDLYKTGKYVYEDLTDEGKVLAIRSAVNYMKNLTEYRQKSIFLSFEPVDVTIKFIKIFTELNDSNYADILISNYSHPNEMIGFKQARNNVVYQKIFLYVIKNDLKNNFLLDALNSNSINNLQAASALNMHKKFKIIDFPLGFEKSSQVDIDRFVNTRRVGYTLLLNQVRAEAIKQCCWLIQITKSYVKSREK